MSVPAVAAKATEWQTVKLGDVLALNYGKALPASNRNPTGKIPVYGANGIKDYADIALRDEQTLIVGRKGSAGEITRVEGPFWPLDVTYYTSHDRNRLDFDYLAYALSMLDLPSLARGVKPGINRNDVYQLDVQLPPLAEQKRIVAVLDQAFAALDRAGAHAEANLADAQGLFETTKQSILNTASDGGSLVSLADVSVIESSLVDPGGPEYADLPHIGAGNMCAGSGELIDVMTARQEKLRSGKYLFDGNDVLYSKIRPYPRKVARPDFSGLCSADVYPLRPSRVLDRAFLFHTLLSQKFTEYAVSGSARAGMPKVNREHLFKYKFQLPSLEKQRIAVAEIDAVLSKATQLRQTFAGKLTDIADLQSVFAAKSLCRPTELTPHDRNERLRPPLEEFFGTTRTAEIARYGLS